VLHVICLLVQPIVNCIGRVAELDLELDYGVSTRLVLWRSDAFNSRLKRLANSESVALGRRGLVESVLL
jgi:hypothetical protein